MKEISDKNTLEVNMIDPDHIKLEEKHQKAVNNVLDQLYPSKIVEVDNHRLLSALSISESVANEVRVEYWRKLIESLEIKGSELGMRFVKDDPRKFQIIDTDIIEKLGTAISIARIKILHPEIDDDVMIDWAIDDEKNGFARQEVWLILRALANQGYYLRKLEFAIELQKQKSDFEEIKRQEQKALEIEYEDYLKRLVKPKRSPIWVYIIFSVLLILTVIFCWTYIEKVGSTSPPQNLNKPYSPSNDTITIDEIYMPKSSN